MTASKTTKADEEYERLMKLLDIGLDAVRSGDGDGAIMALEAATKVADALPEKPEVICLPDRSR